MKKIIFSIFFVGLLMIGCKTTNGGISLTSGFSIERNDCYTDYKTNIQTDKGCIRIYTQDKLVKGLKNVMIVISGDNPKGKNKSGNNVINYSRFSNETKESTVVVHLIKPGTCLYPEDKKTCSEGIFDKSIQGQRYSKDNSDRMSLAVKQLKIYYKQINDNVKFIFVGHSAGTVYGTSMESENQLFDSLVLSGCPCNIAAWRRAHGYRSVISLNPYDYVSKMRKDVPLVLVFGNKDDNTKLEYSQSYIDKAFKFGLKIEIHEIDANHTRIPKTKAFINIIEKQLSS